MSLVKAEQSILDRLAPLRDCGIWVRGNPDEPNKQGQIQENGSITLSHSADSFNGFMGADRSRQQAEVAWMLEGRIYNLRSNGGLLVLRDSLYRLTIGFKPEGCGPLQATGWTFAERTQQHWRFEYQMSCTQIVAGTPEVDPFDVGATLQEIFFTPVEVSDRYGINTATVTEFGPVVS